MSLNTKDFFSVPDVAKRWDVNHKFVYDLIKSGQLPAIKLGSPGTLRPVIRIPRTSLEAWEQARLEGQGAA